MLRGKVYLAGDKSISHRAVILSAISQGKTEIKNFSFSEDCLATILALKILGIRITTALKRKTCGSIYVYGKGTQGFKAPHAPIHVGDSGTTLRILLGVLAGQNFKCTLTAGKSLMKRPMRRVTIPLRLMGADIKSSPKARLEEYPPITIKGGNLKPITYKMPVASAQVKSAILLAGLYARGVTKIIEPIKSRDHTERMLKIFGAEVKRKDNALTINGVQRLISPGKIFIPGDISSAAFFIVAATLVEGSKIIIKSVSLNPTRTGLLRVLKRMGAAIQIKNLSKIKSFEPFGDIMVQSSKLNGTTITKEEIPSLIDELPVLMVAASFAQGKTIIKGAEELRLKETDRIHSMVTNLTKMGAKIRIFGKKSAKIVIQGTEKLKGAQVNSFGDHRSAMSLFVAGLASEGATQIQGIECIKKSFPDFIRVITSLFS